MKKIKPHKDAPKRLIKVWRRNGENYYKTGQELGVSASWVWQLINNGTKPKRLDLQQKLFLTRKKSKEELEEIRKARKAKKEELDKEVVSHLKEVIREVESVRK